MISDIRAMFHDLAGRGDMPAHIATMELAAATRLWELGLDSLARLNLVIEIEDRFGCHLRDDAISDMTSVQELSSLITGGTAARRQFEAEGAQA